MFYELNPMPASAISYAIIAFQEYFYMVYGVYWMYLTDIVHNYYDQPIKTHFWDRIHFVGFAPYTKIPNRCIHAHIRINWSK